MSSAVILAAMMERAIGYTIKGMETQVGAEGLLASFWV